MSKVLKLTLADSNTLVKRNFSINDPKDNVSATDIAPFVEAFGEAYGSDATLAKAVVTDSTDTILYPQA